MPGGVRWYRPRSGVWFEPRGAPTVSGADASVRMLVGRRYRLLHQVARARRVELDARPIVEAMVIERM